MYLKIDWQRKEILKRLSEIDKQLVDSQVAIGKDFGNVIKARAAQMNNDESATAFMEVRDQLNREKKKLKKDLTFLNDPYYKSPEPRWVIIAECDDDGSMRIQLTLRDVIDDVEQKNTVQKYLNDSLRGLFEMDKLITMESAGSTEKNMTEG